MTDYIIIQYINFHINKLKRPRVAIPVPDGAAVPRSGTRKFPVSLSVRHSSTRSIFARVSARNVAATRKVRETVSASRPRPPYAIISVPPSHARSDQPDRPRYRAERSFSPVAIFTRDSGALWASNGGRVILNNSSYRRNAQVRVCRTTGYARRRARFAAPERRPFGIPSDGWNPRLCPATSFDFAVRPRSVASIPFPPPPAATIAKTPFEVRSRAPSRATSSATSRPSPCHASESRPRRARRGTPLVSELSLRARKSASQKWRVPPRNGADVPRRLRAPHSLSVYFPFFFSPLFHLFLPSACSNSRPRSACSNVRSRRTSLG